MKLKKIASLMLAGIMAVSMLAACGEGKKDDSSSSSSEVTVDNSVAAAVNEELGAAKREILTFESNASLENTLKKFTAAVDLNDPNAGNWYSNNTTEWKTLADLIGAKAGVDAIGHNFQGVPGGEGDVKGLSLLTVSGNLTDKGLARKIVDEIDSYVIQNNYNIAPTGYNCTYKAEIAAVKVTNVIETSSDYVVAIVVTRTAVKAAIT